MSHTTQRRWSLQLFGTILALAFGVAPSLGQWLQPPVPANQVSVSITPTVTFDSATGLYTYSYAIGSRATSFQNVWKFALRIVSAGTVGSSPSGWTFQEYDAEPIVSWAATDTDRVTFTVR